MLPALTSLIALQALDSAADQAKKRIAEIPAAEQALEARLASAGILVDAAKARVAENNHARRQLEKDVAAVDARMARFEDHKAAVKTNQEFTALNHEIATAQTEKNAIEEKILILLEEADALAAELKAAESALAACQRESDEARRAFQSESKALDSDLARLAAERASAIAGVPATALARYEQLLKGRRGLAIAAMVQGHCTACHVRLRPHITQQVRRNDELVPCESCQRLLYYVPPPNAAGAAPAIDTVPNDNAPA